MAFCGSVQSTNMPIICAGDTISWSSSRSRVATASCSNIGTAIYVSVNNRNQGKRQIHVPGASGFGSRSKNNNTRGRNTPNTVSALDSRRYRARDRPPRDSLGPVASSAPPAYRSRRHAPARPKSCPPTRAWRARRTTTPESFPHLLR